MRVALTVNATWNVLNFRLPILQALLAEGHDALVLAPADQAVAALERLGARHVDLPMDSGGLDPVRDARLLALLRRRLREERPDVVLSWTIKNNLYGAVAARSLGIPFVANVPGLGTAFQSGRGMRLAVETLYRLAFRSASTVFFQNVDDQRHFLSRRLIRPAQARLLPGSGIDLGRFATVPVPQGPTTFLLIARLLRNKGVAEFAEAARDLRRRWPDARFLILGSAEAANPTAIGAATLRAWTEEGAVEHLGSTDDVRPHIAAASCIVLPSFYPEGAPRALIEAASMGRPIITTDMPGCRSVVEDGRTGFLCQPRDASSLAAAMEWLLAMPHAERQAMGARGRSKMEREFDQRIVVEAYAAAIERATSPPVATRGGRR